MPHAALHVADVEVLIICEGWAPLPLSEECPGRSVDWSAERSRYPWAFPDHEHWAWHVHAFLLRTSSGDVLVDSGVGAFGPWESWSEEVGAQAWSGVDRTSVRHVVLTHLHADHAGGSVLADGTPRFPNARYHVHPADWEHFDANPVLREADGARYDARTAMSTLAADGLVSLEPGDHEVSPGISVVHTPGHTPGHRSVLLRRGEETLLLTGDLLHLPIAVAHPGWLSSHDEDAVAASESRSRLLGRARDLDWRVAVAHFARPFGSIGLDGWVDD